MSEDVDDIDEAAARWHAMQYDDAMDWDGFTRWLEADPRHRPAYDAIALLDARIDAALPVLRHALGTEPPIRTLRPRRAIGWALAGTAAAAVAAIGIAFMPGNPIPAPTIYRTAQGQVRDVQLADGSSTTLSPGSMLKVSGASRDPLVLNGSARFDIRHDPARPIEIRVGDYSIRDVGTRFEVSASGGMLRVAVTEGRVAVRSLNAGGEVEVPAGQVLTATDSRSAPALTAIRPATPGGWRTGRLTYDDVPLGLIAADIARYSGKSIVVDPRIAKQRFSGILATGSADAMIDALCELANLRKRSEGDAIRLDGGAGR